MHRYLQSSPATPPSPKGVPVHSRADSESCPRKKLSNPGRGRDPPKVTWLKTESARTTTFSRKNYLNAISTWFLSKPRRLSNLTTISQNQNPRGGLMPWKSNSENPTQRFQTHSHARSGSSCQAGAYNSEGGEPFSLTTGAVVPTVRWNPAAFVPLLPSCHLTPATDKVTGSARQCRETDTPLPEWKVWRGPRVRKHQEDHEEEELKRVIL